MLIFLPGEREIPRNASIAESTQIPRDGRAALVRAPVNPGSGSGVSSRPQRRIVLATNVAETSLTVPRIRYVIDPVVKRE